MSKSEVQVLDFEKICRLCLLEKRSMSAIFSKKKSDKNVPLPVRIMSCASLELYEGDGLPASICSKCLLSVNQSYAFKEQCEQADTTLRQYAQRMNETTEDASMNNKAKHDTRVTWEGTEDDDSVETTDGIDVGNESVGVDDWDGKEGECPVKVYDLRKTISQLELPEEEALREANLLRKLLSNKEVVVERKMSKGLLITEEKEKWSIIRKLSQRDCPPSEKEPTGTKSEEKRTVPADSMLKCLESMMKPSRKANSSLVFCKDCNLLMKRSSLSGHNRFVHQKIRRYLCQTCGYATHTGSILRQHIQAVHVGYTFECGECSKKFNLLKRLRKHEELHHSTGSGKTSIERKKICHYCGLAFLRLSYLKTHLLTHTGEFPLQCQYCSRRFRFRWALVQHERLHTGVKPYKCNYCDETFTQNRVRKIHETRSHVTNIPETEVAKAESEPLTF